MKPYHKVQAAFIALPGAIAIIAETSVARSLAAGFIGMLFLLVVLHAVEHFSPRSLYGDEPMVGTIGSVVGISAAAVGVLMPCFYAAGVVG